MRNLKVGDKVIITKTSSTDADKRIGQIGRIRALDLGDPKLPFCIETMNGKCIGWIHRVEKCEDQPKVNTTFKVGDYVVITGNSNGSRNLVGDIGVITLPNSSFPNCWEVIVKDRQLDAGGAWTKHTDMRLATQSEIDSTKETISEYKIGDRIIANGNLAGYENQLGTITDINLSFSHQYEVTMDKDGRSIWSKIVSLANPKVKIGDYVVSLDFCWTIGQIGQVCKINSGNTKYPIAGKFKSNEWNIKAYRLATEQEIDQYLNNNSNTNHVKESRQQSDNTGSVNTELIIASIHATIEFRSAPRGAACISTGSKIQLGN